MSLIKEVKGDPQYITFKRILEETRRHVKIDESMEEARRLHTSRESRALTGKDRYSAKRIIDAAAKDMSVRARLVEIRVSNDKKMSHLREAMEALRRYVSTEYADDLKEFSNAEQRRAFVDRVLKAANGLVAESEQLLNTLDHLIKDLDQSSHSMRHIVDCLKLMENKHGSKAI